MSPTRSPTRIESCPICGHSKLRKLSQSQFGGLAPGPGKPSPERVCREHGGGTRSRAAGDGFAPVSQGWEENYPAELITTSHGSSGSQSRHNKGVPSPCLAFWMSYTPQQEGWGTGKRTYPSVLPSRTLGIGNVGMLAEVATLEEGWEIRGAWFKVLLGKLFEWFADDFALPRLPLLEPQRS